MVPRFLYVFCVITAIGGCFQPLRSQRERPPDNVAPFDPETRDSDLVFVRTGDSRYYYILDSVRGLCFFHAPMYGREHLAPIDCATFPDYERLLEDGRRLREEAQQAEPEPPVELDPEPPAEAPPTAPPGREPFQRAFVQHECSRRARTEEPLEILLSRFQLSQEGWDSGLAAAKAEPETKALLDKLVEEACPKKTKPKPAKKKTG